MLDVYSVVQIYQAIIEKNSFCKDLLVLLPRYIEQLWLKLEDNKKICSNKPLYEFSKKFSFQKNLQNFKNGSHQIYKWNGTFSQNQNFENANCIRNAKIAGNREFYCKHNFMFSWVNWRNIYVLKLTDLLSLI